MGVVVGGDLVGAWMEGAEKGGAGGQVDAGGGGAVVVGGGGGELEGWWWRLRGLGFVGAGRRVVIFGFRLWWC